MVILIWHLGDFVFIRQIKCTHCLHSYVSIHVLDIPCHQTKYLPIYITYHFTILYVHQMYHVYSKLKLVNDGVVVRHLLLAVEHSGDQSEHELLCGKDHFT